MLKVDEIDIFILRELLKDGRTSFVNIGTRCNLTKGAIAKRYDEMKKANIITGSTIEIDPQKFGYSTIAYINIDVDPKYLENLFGYLNTLPELRNYRSYCSKHNIITIAALKTLRHLEHIKDLIGRKYPINEIKTYLWIDVRNIPENILPNTFEDKAKDNKYFEDDTATGKNLVKLDELNIQIVEKLAANSRISFRKIAQELGTTTFTIVRRYESLRKNNYLKPTIQINTRRLGYQATLHFYLTLNSQNNTSAIVDNISKILGISYIVKISGDYDLQIAAFAKDYDDSIRIYDQIIKIPEIKKIDMRIIQLRPTWPGPRQYISTF